MGFGKRSNETDDAFPFMRKDDADDFRELVARVVTDAGVPVHARGDHLIGEDGTQYPLWALAKRCSEAPGGERDWRLVIVDHMEILLTPPQRASDLTEGELFARLHTRLISRDALPDDAQELGPCQRELTEDLRELLVVDLPDSVLALDEADVAGRDIGALWERARINNARATVDSRLDVPVYEDLVFTAALSDSFFFASRVAELGTVLAELYGDRDYPYGVVVSVPHRHQVMVHPLEDPRSVHAMPHFAEIALHESDLQPGSISPLLYWWYGQALRVVSRLDDEANVHILPDSTFSAALRELQRRPRR
jgi:hypothetical protein